ncbi:MAG: hypothetical protein KDA87_25745 [Planctomycetales bacterium]|nr:hypothetical protein [Planctomycetales bacterium]
MKRNQLYWNKHVPLTWLIVGWFGIGLVGCQPQRTDHAAAQQIGAIRGKVVNSQGRAIPEAHVRWQTGSQLVRTNQAGEFALSAAPSADHAIITAAADGYFISSVNMSVNVKENTSDLQIKMNSVPATDHMDYEWVSPHADPHSTGNCGNCHSPINQEWQSSGHANSAKNARFRNLYDGTDVHGHTNVGWNFLADHPDAAGVCHSCHAPSADLEQLAVGDMRNVTGVPQEGVHCDFCHKVERVLVENIGLTHGVFGMQLKRPESASEQIFFGPLDDVDRGEDVYSPLHRTSEFCAPCHEGIVFGVPVYSTYSEWLDSPAKQAGQQCQDCHMKPTGQMTNFAPDAGGLERNPQTLASHNLLPGGRQAVLQQAMDLKLQVRTTPEWHFLRVQVTAKNVGHRIPTGFIDRHLLLLVEATDANQNPVQPDKGPTLPAFVGPRRHGQAGVLFAKYLTSADQTAPIPFWQASEQVQDSRLHPDQPEVFVFQFARKPDAPITGFQAKVVYRRFWESVAVAKDWGDEEILVAESDLSCEFGD